MLVVSKPIYVANHAVDMRKSIDGLMLLVVEHFKHNPTDGAYYLFCNRLRNKIKVLYWDSNGFALWYKRLEKGCFQFRFNESGEQSLSADQFHWLMSGLNPYQIGGRKTLKYSVFQ